ncbi:MAG: hypothetical protein MMC33_003124 [Icmadophila ericetorum]|nr:hypothetical protein [Icmadophila ericetorum]
MRVTKGSLILSSFGWVGVTGANAAACNADNCLRAVRATSFPTRDGLADCNSYLATTITPDPTTFTATATATQTVATVTVSPDTESESERKRIARPRRNLVEGRAAIRGRQNPRGGRGGGGIPTYASACSGSVRYSSACSCVGANVVTVTAAQLSTTVTGTVTVSETATVTTTVAGQESET